jgi:heterodisulfide reductase subunit A-like polyferredoxin
MKIIQQLTALLILGSVFFACTTTQKKVEAQSTIVIVGGGVSGVSSALQAARMGEKVKSLMH